MSEFCVVGGSGHARVLIHGLIKLGHRVNGYSSPRDEGEAMRVSYLGTDAELLEGIAVFPKLAVLGIGKVVLKTRRLERLEQYQASGFHFPPIYTRGANVHADVSSDAACVVLDGAVVVTGSRLGRACIINTNATVDHDCTLGDDVHVAPGATLSGGVVIGDRCLIGTGANVIQLVHVCPDCMIGAGATVTDDITVPGIYVGTPARRIT
ncbi:MAG: NeuD/PglB/VioB family sugar acetyltransferase [Pseudomonadota bacterium]